MGKALVIKNANFSENKVATVTFTDVTCNGITLSDSTLTLENRAGTTLTYVVDPVTTTDPVVWKSSDESVISVLNGVLTVEGIGSCTITVRCGKHSATCAVTVDLYETPYYYIGFISTPKADDNEHTIVHGSRNASTNVVCAEKYSESMFPDYLRDMGNASVVIGDEATKITALRIPNNVHAISVSGQNIYRDTSSNGPNIVVIFMDAYSEYNFNNSPHMEHKGSETIQATTVGTCSGTVEVPEGANAFVVGVRAKTGTVISSVTSYNELKTAAEDTLGIRIHYLSEMPD